MVDDKTKIVPTPEFQIRLRKLWIELHSCRLLLQRIESGLFTLSKEFYEDLDEINVEIQDGSDSI